MTATATNKYLTTRNNRPGVSVVMSVYNDSDWLPQTIESVLSQEAVEVEFIILNDGSTDDSLDVISRYAANDYRVRVFTHANQGLTKSLMIGCQAASMDLIARQDAKDESLPGRLAAQADILNRRPHVRLVGCGCEQVGPKGERLSKNMVLDAQDICDSLENKTTDNLLSPQHGCTMFRKQDYELVGGYRVPFYYAQDLDLWTRLTDIGTCHMLPDVLYRSVFTPSDISAQYKFEQSAYKNLITEGTRSRRAGGSEGPMLAAAEKISNRSRSDEKSYKGEGLYFLGSSLHKTDPEAAREYLWAAVKENPARLRYWLRFFHSMTSPKPS